MQYKCVVVTAQQSCGKISAINNEVEGTCNSMASQGYVLVNFWESHVNTCGGPQHAICLVFVRP
jgi:hypothetical protein